MKKRMLAVLLALCLLLPAVPAMAAEGENGDPAVVINGTTVTIGGIDYALALGQGIQLWNGSLGYWLDHVNRGFICNENEDPSQMTNTFRYYLFLYDYNSYLDAPQEAYDTFWNAGITMEGLLDDVTSLTVGTAADGYHKYVSASVEGECSGQVSVMVKQDDITAAQLSAGYTYTKAQKLELEWSENVGTVTIPNVTGNNFYHIDLDTELINVTVTGTMTGESIMGRVALGQKEEGQDERILWNQNGTFAQTVTDDQLLLHIQNMSLNEAVCTITVTKMGEQPEQPGQPEWPEQPGEPGLMFRYLQFDQSVGNWVENTQLPLQPISALTCDISSPRAIRLYYGALGNAEPLTGETLNNEDSSVISVSGDNGTYYLFNPVGIGTTTMTYGEHSFSVSVDLPDSGLYTAQVRDAAHYIQSGASLSQQALTDGTLWLMSENGYTEEERSAITVMFDTETTDSYQWVKRDGGDTYDLKIILPEYEVNTAYQLKVLKDEMWLGWAFISYEVPQLMYRNVQYNPVTGTYIENEQWPLQSISNLNLQGINGWAVRLYYGTQSQAIPLSGGELSSSDLGVIKASGDNSSYCFIQTVSIGTATLSYGAYRFDVVVSLPDMGFYSEQLRDADHLLSPMEGVSWYDLSDGTVWLMSEAGYTEADRELITITIGETTVQNIEWMQRGDTGTYDLKISLPDPTVQSGFYVLQATYKNMYFASISVNATLSGSAAYIDDLVIGLAREEANGEITVISEGLPLFGTGTIVLPGESSYSPMWKIKVSAATKHVEDETTVYTEDKKVCESLKVKHMWIEVISGDGNAFSWNGEHNQLSLSQISDRYVWIYGKEGIDCSAMVFAEVEVVVNGKTSNVTVSAPISRQVISTLEERRPDNDTVEALNARLEELAQAIDPNSQSGSVHAIYLGNTIYEGTIVIPSGFDWRNAIHLYGGSNTVIKGSIDLNGERIEMIHGIHFVASDSAAVNGVTRALYGSGCNFMLYCTFQGYDVAVDSSSGLINAYQGNVFVDNDIAILVDIEEVTDWASLYRTDWQNNTFVRNETALQVLSLQDPITPYYFRIFNSNFIGNGCDFDIQCEGNFYFYRNYYAKIHDHSTEKSSAELIRILSQANTESKLNQVVQSQPCKAVKLTSGSKVFTDFRWKYPVLEGISPIPLTVEGETPFVNILVSDWTQETQIVNKEADELILDASAFDVETTEQKVIHVVDENEAALGTWTFD